MYGPEYTAPNLDRWFAEEPISKTVVQCDGGFNPNKSRPGRSKLRALNRATHTRPSASRPGEADKAGLEELKMKRKYTKPLPVKRTKQKARKSTGKPCLHIEQQLGWLRLWEMRQSDGTIEIPQPVLAKTFGKSQPTICEWMNRYVIVGALVTIRKNKRDDAGNQMTDIYRVYEPPQDIVRRFHPYQNSDTDKTSNSSTTSSVSELRYFGNGTDNVNEEPVKDKENVDSRTSTDTSRYRNSDTDKVIENEVTSPNQSSDTAQVPPRDRAILQELREELAGWQAMGRADLAAKAKQEITEFLKGRIE
jgi:hypothetical protein